VLLSWNRRAARDTGIEAFVQSAQIDLDKGCETARKKTVVGSGGATSLLIGNWREPLRLTLDKSTFKKLHSLPIQAESHSRYAMLEKANFLFPPWYSRRR